MDEELDLGDPAAGTSYGRERKEPDDSDEPATKGEFRELLSDIREINASIRADFNEANASMRAEFDRKLERKLDEKLADIFAHIERNRASSPAKCSPTSPKPVDSPS